MSLYQEFALWSQWFWPLFANHLWHTTLFALIAWAAVMILKSSPARARYFIWLLAFSKFILPSVFLIYCLEWGGIDLLQVFTGGEQSGFGNVEMIFQIAQPFSTEIITSSGSEMNSGQPGAYGESLFYSGLSIVWILGAAYLLIRWSLLRRRFAQALLSGMEAAKGREAAAFERVKTWMLINKEVRLVIAKHPCQPGVWGIFRPTIILPEGVGERLTDEELEAVMMHELLHTLRHDNLLSTLQMLVCYLFWFHPLVWLIDRKLLAEREVICDEDVIRYLGEVRPYVAGLWKVAQFELGWNFAGASRATDNNLKGRIKNMLDRSNLGPISKKERILAMLTFSVLIAVGGGMVLFSHDGARAQNPGRKQSKSQKGVPGGVPGGVSSGVPGGVSSGVPGGIPGGVPGGIPGGVPGGIPGGVPGGVPGGIPSGVPGGIPGGDIEGIGVDTISGSSKPQGQVNIEQQLEQAPVFYLKFENSAESPFTVADSRIRFVKIDHPNQYTGGVQRARTSVYFQPTVKLLNRTNKRITGLAVKVKGESGELDKYSETIIQNSAVSIGPGEIFNFSAIYYRPDEENPAIVVDRLILEVYGALFED